MQSIYISGKITGLDPRVAKELFDQAEAKLREMGYQPINPMALVQEHPEKKWEDYMLEDFALLLPADGVYMLANWRESKGATIEHDIAVHMGKKLLYSDVNTRPRHLTVLPACPGEEDFIRELGISELRDTELCKHISLHVSQATSMVDAMHKASLVANNANELAYVMMHVGVLFNKKGTAMQTTQN